MSKRLRFSALLLAVITIFSLVGCTDKEEKPQNTTEVTTAVTTKATENTETTTTAESPTTEKPKELTGRKIVVDAGHGCTEDYLEPIAPGLDPTNPEGPGTGTCGVVTNIPEKDLTLQIALALQKELKNKGAEVVMIRSTQGTKLSLQQRSEIGNKAKADFSIRIHADGLDSPDAEGATLLYPGSQYVGSEVSTESKIIAETLIDSYCKETGLFNRGISERDDLTGFNFSTIPVVLIELGFMTNPAEDEKMANPNFQKKMVKGIVAGITDYYKSK